MRIPCFQMCAVGEPMVRAEIDLGTPAAHQALVRVIGSGVCHTDLGFLDDGVPTRHPLPLVLGHEVVGEVVSQGGSEPFLLGQTVIVPAVMPCMQCELCIRGRGNICRSQVFPGNDVHGGFASHLKVPARALCRVPTDQLPARELPNLSVVADAVSTAYQAVKNSGLSAGDVAIFVGIGGVGGFGVQIAAALGAHVFALDVDHERLQRMREHGAQWTFNVEETSAKELKKKIRIIVKEKGLPECEWRVFETSGTTAGQETAFSLLTFGSYLGVVGFSPRPAKLRLSSLMALAATAEGTWGCRPDLFPEVLDLVVSEKVCVNPFVKQFPMSQINTVFERLRKHELSVRPVLIPDFDASDA